MPEPEDSSLFDDEFEDVEPAEEELGELSRQLFSGLTVSPTDWTVETVFNQIGKQIDLDPEFQRRNVWNVPSKSGFIESLILGIPIPQILLSAKKSEKNSFVVLDGKQRLLTIMEFLSGKLPNGREFRLKDLKVLKELENKSWNDIKDDDRWNYELLNETIRTAIIRGWEDERLLYEIFRRLNSGSVKLSPMELRMSLHPGQFLKFVIRWTESPGALHVLLNKKGPDPRMQDVEIVVRYLAFQLSVAEYKGALKEYLDETCKVLNEEFSTNTERKEEIEGVLLNMTRAIDAGIEIFGRAHFCRKYLVDKQSYEPRFNRAAFDVLVGSLSDPSVRNAALGNKQEFEQAYIKVSAMPEFRRSIESSTKSVPATRMRFATWYQAVADLTGIELSIPRMQEQ